MGINGSNWHSTSSNLGPKQSHNKDIQRSAAFKEGLICGTRCNQHCFTAWFNWTNINVFISILLVQMYVIGTFPAMASELVCPEPCKCSYPSAYPSTMWSPSTDQSSINCSNQSLEEFIEVPYSFYDFDGIENDTSLRTIQGHHLHVLDLSRNLLSIAQLDGNFSWLSIDAINFSHNFISGLKVDATCILSSVSDIDLSFNRLESMHDLTKPLCIGFYFLTKINVSHNSIKEVTNISLSSLVHLTSLDLSYNRLQSISRISFAETKSLKHLFLNNNNITDIKVLPNIPNLVTLDLSKNHLNNLPDNVFSNLNLLKTLDLSHNKITYLDANVFNGLTNLVELYIDQNPIISLDKPVFQNTALEKLSLSSMNRLTNVTHDAFSGLRYLTYLNISHNQELHFLQPNILSPMTALKILDLSHSGFQQLSSSTFLNSKLRKVYLSGLHLSCVCNNAWLVEEIVSNNSVFIDIASNRCVDARNQLQDISVADFKCGAVNINSTSDKLTVRLGSNLMLQCQQASHDPGVLTWTTPSGQKFHHHDYHSDALLHLLSPEQVQPTTPYHKNHYWHHTSSYHSELASNSERILILTDGSLYIDYMLRYDTGEYKCEVMNAHFNRSISVTLHLKNDISGRIKIFAFVAGFLCALGFFTLNVVYVIISWTARRLVNKRRREAIIQMLEGLNSYKSVQISRIHENYTYQLNRVRNQYHIQRDKLNKNYTGQVDKVKRGCSNQVERVRDNYNSKLAHLREYSSKQVLIIRESANTQIGRIRDYGSLQLERLRETYKLQHQHVMKLLDTMNLDNCRSVVETECMRTESMMFDIDLLESYDRVDSPTSEYNTAASSPNSSDNFTMEMDDDNISGQGEEEEIGEYREDCMVDTDDDCKGQGDNIEIEMNTHLSLAHNLQLDAKEVWQYSDHDDINKHTLHTNVHGPGLERYPSKNKSEKHPHSQLPKLAPLPQYTVSLDHHGSFNSSPSDMACEESSSGKYSTPEASPVKMCPPSKKPDGDRVDMDEMKGKDDRKGQEESEL